MAQSSICNKRIRKDKTSVTCSRTLTAMASVYILNIAAIISTLESQGRKADIFFCPSKNLCLHSVELHALVALINTATCGTN